MKEAIIKFRNLSWPCKVGIILGWVAGCIFAASYIIGFVIGVLSV